MKDLSIFIPTYGRSDKQITYNNLSEEIRNKVVLVIHPSEEKLYEGYNYLVCPSDEISKKRAWIIRNCKTKFLVMLDDDLKFCRRKSEDDWKLKYIDKTNEVTEMFENILFVLRNGYHHVGISARMGNNRIKDSLVENTRMFGVLAYNVKTILKEVELERVKFHEDFDITLQLLYKGYKNLVFYNFAKDDATGYNSEGGCSIERNLERHNESVIHFNELHKGFTNIRRLNNKGGGELSERLELTVYWKKSYESSKK